MGYEEKKQNEKRLQPHWVSHNLKEGKPHTAEPRGPKFYPSLYIKRGYEKHQGQKVTDQQFFE